MGDIELCKIGDYTDKIKQSVSKNLYNLANILESGNILNKGVILTRSNMNN